MSMPLRRFLPLLLLLAAAATLVLIPSGEAEARRGFSGFGRSSLRIGGSGFARKGILSRRSIGWGRASVRRRSAAGAAGGRVAGWGGNIERRVGTRGKAFGSRRGAEAASRQGLKTSWKSKPAKRPDYVPRRVSRDGKRYDVVFNNGRYGYWGPGGAWVALGAASMLASGAGYGAPGYRDPARAGAWPAFLGTLGLFALVMVLSRRGGRC